jgi:hypothetical protein
MAMAAGYCILAATTLAVALIEYGGERSPLVVAAFGTATGELIIFVSAGLGDRWSIAYGSLIGGAFTLFIYGILRTRDPTCAEPRFYGRSSLLMAGCWLGGLGLRPAALGVAVWVVVYFVCMVAHWLSFRGQLHSDSAGRHGLQPLISAPLVTSVGLALALSLLVRAL